jgi:ribosomal protein S9
MLMTSIARFAPVTGAFDPDATRVLGKAFDMACALVGHTAQPTATREAIAKAIVETAKQGERDPHRLRDAGLAAVENR